MIVVMAAGSRETRCRALKCLNMALALSAGARRADSRLLRVCSSGVGQGFFVGTRMPIPAPWYPFGQDRYPRPGRPVQGWQHMEHGRGRVVGGAGLHRARVDGEPGETPSPPAHCRRTPRPCPNTTGGGPCPGCAEPPGRCGSGSRPGSRSVLWTGAVAGGPRAGPGPGRRSRPEPHADTGRRWPGSSWVLWGLVMPWRLPRRESRRVRAGRGPGSRPARCGGAHRPARPGAGQTPAPACAAPAAHAGHPGALPPGARQAPGLPRIPGARVEAARPTRGEDPLSTPGRRPRSTSWRAGGTGRRESSGRGRSCTPTRSGRCRPGAGPAAPPLRWSMQSVDQRDGRSHSAAIDKPTRSARSRPRPRLADLQRRLPGAPGPSVVVPGRSPATDPNPLTDPGRAGPRGQPPTRRPRAANTPQAGPGRARAPRRQPDRTSSELIGVLPGCGHDPHPSMDSDPPPHPGRSSTRGPLVVTSIGQNALSRAAPARTTPTPAQPFPHHHADPRQSRGPPSEKVLVRSWRAVRQSPVFVAEALRSPVLIDDGDVVHPRAVGPFHAFPSE